MSLLRCQRNLQQKRIKKVQTKKQINFFCIKHKVSCWNSSDLFAKGTVHISHTLLQIQAHTTAAAHNTRLPVPTLSEVPHLPPVTEAVRQMGRIVRALKSGKNRWKVKQVRKNEKMEKHKEKNCEKFKSKRYIFAQHLE